MPEADEPSDQEADQPLAGKDKMFTVYVLKSLKNSKRYIGYTSKTANIRLHEHNAGSNTFTRKNKPFILVYTEQYKEKVKALQKEKFLKTGQGRKFLDSIILGV